MKRYDTMALILWGIIVLMPSNNGFPALAGNDIPEEKHIKLESSTTMITLNEDKIKITFLFFRPLTIQDELFRGSLNNQNPKPYA